MIGLGLQGTSDGGSRDLTIDAMKEVAKRLTTKYPARVQVVRYEDGGYDIEGFMVWTGPVRAELGTEWLGPTIHVPVRKRLVRWRIWPLRRCTSAWEDVQSVPEAAAAIARAVRLARR